MQAHRPPPLERHAHESWIVAELGARGEIDDHAALCLRNALDATDAGATETVWVDLRDLLGLDAAALAMLAQESADCRVRGFELAVLLSGHALHDPIAALVADADVRFARSTAGDSVRGEPHPVARARAARPVSHAAQLA